MARELSTQQKVLLVVVFLISGSINTMTKKWQFQSCGPSDHVIHDDGKPTKCPEGEKHFHKPWTQNIQMFCGEASVMALFFARRKQHTRDIVETGTPGGRPPFYIFLLPCCCDVLGTGVGGVGMLYISASVWQMMRGSLIIFTSMLSVIFLKRKLYCYNYLAVFTCTFGLFLVGLSAVLDEGASASNAFLGIFLTVCAQMFSAAQMVVEELYVKGHNAPPEQVVGSEGVWGIMVMIIMLTVMYFVPGNDAGSYENVVDSLHMLAGGGDLLLFVLVYLISIAIFNFCGITIAGKLSAVHRTINDAMRTMIIWTVEIIVYYGMSKTYGAAWTPHTYLQLVGFAFIILGNMVNNAIFKIPGLYYPEANKPAPVPHTASENGSTRGVSLINPTEDQQT